jgi:putative transposase
VTGFEPRTERTRLGEIEFAVPKVREGGFRPQALEKGLRSERASTPALAEMYVQGVSARKVTAIVEQLCGSTVSSSLDEQVKAWRTRPLGEIPYLYLDARCERVRQDGQIRDAALLVAIGVDPSGHHRVLGVSVSVGEHEVQWSTFLHERVKQAGVTSPQLALQSGQATALRRLLCNHPDTLSWYPG